MNPVQSGTVPVFGRNVLTFLRKDAAAFFTCLAAMVFPFSVAGTNSALGAALILTVLTGSWWQGAKKLWHSRRRFCLALAAYLSMVVLGLIWSIDRDWGVHILLRHWFWLLLPMGMVLFEDRIHRWRLLFFLSLGLTLHLGYCVLQKYGLVTTTTDGSYAADATGHIGHIGFGFVYGIWAAWLVHWGWLRKERRRLAWILAAWAWAMVFLAMGRSGYAVTLISAVIVVWMHFRERRNARVVFLLILVAAAGSLGLFGSTRSSLERTWTSVRMLATGDLQRAVRIEERFGLWLIGLQVWWDRPVLGVGTGGYPKASRRVSLEHPEWVLHGRFGQVHPFDIYLLSLCRWGLSGIFLLLWLLYEWSRMGWKADWRSLEAIPFVPLTGIALAVHGFTSSSIEEHFSALFAVMLLSAGLAEMRNVATRSAGG